MAIVGGGLAGLACAYQLKQSGQTATVYEAYDRVGGPGITAKWNGRAAIDYWLGNPGTKGSYSFWKVDQYTRFAGVPAQVESSFWAAR